MLVLRWWGWLLLACKMLWGFSINSTFHFPLSSLRFVDLKQVSLLHSGDLPKLPSHREMFQIDKLNTVIPHGRAHCCHAFSDEGFVWEHSKFVSLLILNKLILMIDLWGKFFVLTLECCPFPEFVGKDTEDNVYLKAEHSAVFQCGEVHLFFLNVFCDSF